MNNTVAVIKKVSFLVLLCFLINACNPVKHNFSAEKGILDLSKYTLRTQGNVALSGNWAFYWDTLYTPQNINSSQKVAYITVPGDWNHFNKGKAIWQAGDGFGTYRLQVILGGNNRQQNLGIFVPIVATAATVWVNGKLANKCGQVGTDSQTSVPDYNTFTTFFEANDDTLDIVVQMSNFDYRRGGAWGSFVLGSEENLKKRQIFSIIEDFTLTGSLLIIGLYYLIVFLVSKKDKSIVFFGVFCLIMSIRILFSEDYNHKLLVELPWIWVVRLEVLSYYIGFMVFNLFSYHLFPRQFSKKIIVYTTVFCAAMASVTLFTSVKFFSFTVVPFEIFTLLMGFYQTVVCFKAFQKKEEGSLLFLIASLVIFITISNDILYLNNILATGRLVSLGIFTFVFFLALMLARRLSLAYTRLKESNDELVEKNQEIEDKNVQLTKLNEELDSFVYRTSHDLRSPIASMMGLLEILKLEKDDENRTQYFEMGEKVLKRMDNLITDIIDFARNSRTDIVLTKVDFQMLIEDTFANFAFMENALSIEKKHTIEQTNDFYSDSKRISFILNNLVSNAIKYHDLTKKNPLITIDVKVNIKKVEIVVRDNGQGIENEYLDKIFQMFYRATTTSKGAGLGLYIVKETVARLGGHITVVSEINVGTTFTITLPNKTTEV
ncbi:MAG: sensor histidine kinase [Verrucomicrobia bacterium]|nr:sensor histidine kinase [Cytophagales bacterium]